MAMQIFRPWNGRDLPPLGKVLFEGIVYDAGGMVVRLKEMGGEGRPISLKFQDLPTAVRIANESMRLATLPLVPKGDVGSIFLVDNSEFLDWLNRDSLGIYKDDPVFHLAIVTEEWVDLICNEEPIVVFDRLCE